MQGILEFIKNHAKGVTEQEITQNFPLLSKTEIAKELNACLKHQQISLFRENGILYYKSLGISGDDYELMIYNLVSQNGGEGVWLKTIKDKTNMPHTLIGKVLRSMEAKRIIKSVKCLKNNRKMYVLYDETPSEEITGGTWFHDNDVDFECVSKILEIVLLYLEKNTTSEDGQTLPEYEANPTIDDILEYIKKLNILSIPLKHGDLEVIADILVFDGKAEKLYSEAINRYRVIK
ncbi:subunit C34 of DNA-directed RNA polymerase III [Ordospora colligata]|uniref:DNA-directed RNA polymerase III subunit RPC6 n=1 Tax=Ordospora colligata OC4 TaxID=1354746 RepID=A0A0B2UJR8_9MICR|nr:subunit C34 of DNA-directed RNA polymerase III [Ordospora colligata OC4]KHN69608.1 subunit C34 of DNA-directed RNA polymerase III [Ordospora colligata OC4]TBU15727.1 subunit C34 of DNA-directed RNA polymerase III [Ordospora colligata]TBU15855.1 subunit C34 of DNA-directed RNA polymerase III [Ordospora colligata]TBU18749.1 subunit C34 of DNA-directed RNA polymerase III [Ordospora colligata]